MENQQTNNQLPEWFADTQGPQPVSSSRPPTKPLKKPPILLGLILLALLLIGGTIWYLFSAQAAKMAAFEQFRDAYYSLETDLVELSDITEPDDLGTKDPQRTWEKYSAAFEALTTSAIYQDNSQLIENIRAQNQTYETYVSGALPKLLHFLSECYTRSDEVMYGQACRDYVQAAIDSDDPLTNETSQALLSVLEQASQTNTLTDIQMESILTLQEKFFDSGMTVVNSLRPHVVALGEKLGVTVLTEYTE